MQLFKCNKTYYNKNIKIYLLDDGCIAVDVDDDNSEQVYCYFFYNPSFNVFSLEEKGGGSGHPVTWILSDKSNREFFIQKIETIDKTFRFKKKDFIVSKLKDLITENTPKPKKSIWQKLKEELS